MYNQLIYKTLDLAIQIQQIPAPTFNEQRRAEFVHQRFQQEGLETEIDAVGNVLARFPGQGDALPVVVVAHLDTVFPESMDISFVRQPDKISGPGIGDNSLGVASLFGLIWAARDLQGEFPGDLWLVADVGEEGLGDLCGMRAVVDRFEDKVSAYIIVEGLALGQVYHRGLGIRRYRLSARTPGGHSWTDFGKPSAIHELARFINSITNLQLPSNPRTSLNVGVISGGVSVNTIANQATLELDLRSESQTTLSDLVNKVLNLVQNSNRQDVTITAELIGNRPSGELPGDHPLVKAAADGLQNRGITPQFHASSTDANIPLSKGFPAVGVGITNGGGAHTPGEYINTAPVSQGLEILSELVQQAFNLANR